MMKRNKDTNMKTRFTMAACLCAAVFAGSAFAQSGPRIGVDSVRISQSGGEVDVALRLDIPRGTIKQNYSLFYTPVLLSGSHELALPAVELTGARKRLSDLRKLSVNKIDSSSLAPVFRGREGLNDYLSHVPYARWMSGGEVRVVFDRRRESYTRSVDLGRFVPEGAAFTLRHPWAIYTPVLAVADTAALAGDELLMARARSYANDGRYAEAVDMLSPLAGDREADALMGIWRMAQDSAVRTALFPLIGLGAGEGRYTLSLPAVEVGKAKERMADTLRVGVQFAVKRTSLDVLPDSVSVVLERMAALAAEAVQAGEALPEITVTGASSPEGKDALNRRLAGERAAWLLSCLREACARRGVTLADSQVKVVIQGADWAGLRALVEASDEIEYRKEALAVLDTTPEVQRMARLKAIKWQRPYWYAYKHLFPQLRCATVLTMTLGAGDCDEAGGAIAAATQKIDAGDYAGALLLLEPWAGDPRAVLPLAVSYALTGDMDNAKIYAGHLNSMIEE